ncbi:MAG TPA: hypothetical protein GX736_01620 [Mogibacterium sp.]|nr:hypothetical protein [Mogibacterium sp.]
MRQERILKENIDWDRVSLLIKIGIAGAVINLAGDLISGWGVRNMCLPGIEGMVSHYLLMSDKRIFWSAMLGLVGVPVSGIGHIGIYKLIRPYSRKYAGLYGVGIFGCYTFGGSGVHMSSLAAVFFYKYMTAAAPETALAASIKFLCYFSLPLYIALMTCWLIQAYAHIRVISIGLSPYPRWCWVFTTPVGTLIAGLFSIFGNYAIVNAITVGAFTLGNIWTLGGHLFMLDKARENWGKSSAYVQ